VVVDPGMAEFKRSMISKNEIPITEPVASKRAY